MSARPFVWYLVWLVLFKFVRRMASRQRLDLESVLTQLVEKFASVEEEYKALGDQELVATASDSDGEAEMTALGSVLTAEQLDVTADGRKREEEGLDVPPSNHRVVGMTSHNWKKSRI